MFISIIIPCYNSERFLKETLDSVFAQSYKSYEVICVDNGSTDGTISIIEKYRDQYSNLNLVVDHRRGANYARNTGIRVAKGDVFQFLDSDDIISHDKLEKQVEIFEKGFDVVVSDREIYNSDLTKKLKSMVFQNIEKEPLLVALTEVIITGNPLYRRSALESLGNWNEEFESAQDWELNIHLALEGKKFGYLPGYFLISRQVSNSLSNNWIAVNFNAVKVLELYREKLLVSGALENNLVQRKIFFTYFLAAVNAKENDGYIKMMLDWNFCNRCWKYLSGLNFVFCRLFGLKNLIKFRAFIKR